MSAFWLSVKRKLCCIHFCCYARFFLPFQQRLPLHCRCFCAGFSTLRRVCDCNLCCALRRQVVGGLRKVTKRKTQQQKEQDKKQNNNTHGFSCHFFRLFATTCGGLILGYSTECTLMHNFKHKFKAVCAWHTYTIHINIFVCICVRMLMRLFVFMAVFGNINYAKTCHTCLFGANSRVLHKKRLACNNNYTPKTVFLVAFTYLRIEFAYVGVIVLCVCVCACLALAYSTLH